MVGRSFVVWVLPWLRFVCLFCNVDIFAIFAVVLLHRFGLIAAVFADSVSCAHVSGLLVVPGG